MFRRDELTRDQKRDRAIAAVNRAVADGAEQMDCRGARLGLVREAINRNVVWFLAIGHCIHLSGVMTSTKVEEIDSSPVSFRSTYLRL